MENNYKKRNRKNNNYCRKVSPESKCVIDYKDYIFEKNTQSSRVNTILFSPDSVTIRDFQ